MKKLSAILAVLATTAAASAAAPTTDDAHAAKPKRCTGDGKTLKKNRYGRISAVTEVVGEPTDPYYGDQTETTIYGCSTATGENVDLLVLESQTDVYEETIAKIDIRDRKRVSFTRTRYVAGIPEDDLDPSRERTRMTYSLRTGKLLHSQGLSVR